MNRKSKFWLVCCGCNSLLALFLGISAIFVPYLQQANGWLCLLWFPWAYLLLGLALAMVQQSIFVKYFCERLDLTPWQEFSVPVRAFAWITFDWLHLLLEFLFLDYIGFISAHGYRAPWLYGCRHRVSES